MEKMVVLANSRKPGGYCMAGKAWQQPGHVGGWVRPVMATAEDGLPLVRTVCSDGHQAALLDVVVADWGPRVPALHQHENRLLGPAALRRCGRAAWEDLPALADEVTSDLWLDGFYSTCGLNDRVPTVCLAGLPGSLKLVAVRELVIYRTIGYEGRVKNRADFRLGERRYNLALTDPVAIFWLSQMPRMELPDAYVCVSLAVPFGDGFAYKVAAAVITKERAGSTI
jgi:hypothetical protein